MFERFVRADGRVTDPVVCILRSFGLPLDDLSLQRVVEITQDRFYKTAFDDSEQRKAYQANLRNEAENIFPLIESFIDDLGLRQEIRPPYSRYDTVILPGALMTAVMLRIGAMEKAQDWLHSQFGYKKLVILTSIGLLETRWSQVQELARDLRLPACFNLPPQPESLTDHGMVAESEQMKWVFDVYARRLLADGCDPLLIVHPDPKANTQMCMDHYLTKFAPPDEQLLLFSSQPFAHDMQASCMIAAAKLGRYPVIDVCSLPATQAMGTGQTLFGMTRTLHAILEYRKLLGLPI